mmetsp:Transcript_37028/g.86089  ORF Transcript_37028/g.86089 Transcript_37028/m.86089 type:complete len:113 (-) Transcript_37028:123-461(-)
MRWAAFFVHVYHFFTPTTICELEGTDRESVKEFLCNGDDRSRREGVKVVVPRQHDSVGSYRPNAVSVRQGGSVLGVGFGFQRDRESDDASHQAFPPSFAFCSARILELFSTK